ASRLRAVEIDLRQPLGVVTARSSVLCILEQLREAPDDFAGDLATDILAIVVVAQQYLYRGVAGELARSAHVAVGFVERSGDRRMPQPMRTDDPSKLRSHGLQDLVDAIAGKAAAGQHPPALAELEEERAWLLAT